MPVEITAGDHDAVRAAIDTSLSPANLPPEVIGLDIYKGRAERWIAARTTNTDAHAKAAAVYMCAAFLVPAVPHLSSESLPGASYQRVNFDPNEQVKRLEGMAADELALSLNGGVPPAPATTPEQPSHFGVASGRRGV
jgi:hypothetical protein